MAKGSQGFAQQLFVQEGAIDFGGIEESDAAIDGGVKESDHLLFVLRRPVGKAHSHAAQAQGGNFQATFSEFAFLHFLSFGGALPSTSG